MRHLEASGFTEEAASKRCPFNIRNVAVGMTDRLLARLSVMVNEPAGDTAAGSDRAPRSDQGSVNQNHDFEPVLTTVWEATPSLNLLLSGRKAAREVLHDG